MTRAVVALALLVLPASVGLAPTGLAQGGDVPPDVPWPARIGVQALACEATRPIAPQVTLVPDAATYLDEVSRWSKDARWPVLIDEPRFAPMFVRAFKPERIVRRESVGTLPARDELAARLESLAKAAMDGRPAAPCAVVTSVDDPAWLAAAALCAGRGAPLAFVDGAFGDPNDVLPAEQFSRLDAALNAAMDGLGVPWRDLGDAVDAIALCRSLAAKATPDLAPEARPQLPPEAPVRADEPCAVTDALARKATGQRSAIVGWIFGDEARSAYMAMCSLFLPRKDVRFVSGYGTGEPWSFFDPTSAAALMAEKGFTTSVHMGERASVREWERLLMGGLACDLLIMNSSGEPTFFNLTDNGRADVGDVPFFDRPVALHLIHSWSLVRPADRQTVGGRMLERGVYAYVGSVQEPLLSAFVPPAALASRLLGLGPFLVSGRMLEGMFDRVWRVTLIGDPLCTLAPPQGPPFPRAPLPELNGTDVLAEAKSLMREFAAGGDAAAARKAMRNLVTCGADEVAVGFHTAAMSRGAGAEVASEALGPLFRARSYDAFVEAFTLCREKSPDAIDMLWQLATPRAQSLDADGIALLRSHLRGPDVSYDLRRLLPAVDRVMGRRESDRIVQDEMDRTKDPSVAARLSELLRR